MNKTSIDTWVTSEAFRADLSNIDFFISSCNPNTETCNTYVSHVVDSLQARGEILYDLFTHIFKEYKVASDIKFVSSIDLW